MLTTLLSVRIKAELAVDAARELFRAGWRTPTAMRHLGEAAERVIET